MARALLAVEDLDPGDPASQLLVAGSGVSPGLWVIERDGTVARTIDPRTELGMVAARALARIDGGPDAGRIAVVDNLAPELVVVELE